VQLAQPSPRLGHEEWTEALPWALDPGGGDIDGLADSTTVMPTRAARDRAH